MLFSSSARTLSGNYGGLAVPCTRALSASERAWAGPNPDAWFNLVRAIRFKRAIDPGAFQKAITGLQQEFVELRSCLSTETRNTPVLIENGRSIPVRTFTNAAESDVLEYLTDELRVPVGCEGDPLMRAALFVHDDAATIVLTVHHVIIDRNSTKTLIGQLLSTFGATDSPATTGKTRVALNPSYLGAARAACALAWERRFSGAGQPRRGLKAPLSDRTHFCIQRFDTPETRLVHAHAEEVGTRVTALISAAALEALDRLHPAADGSARVGIAFDLTTGERMEGLGSQVGMPIIDLRKSDHAHFQARCLMIEGRIDRLRASSAARDSASLLALSGRLLRSLARRGPFRLGTLAVTNLGELELECGSRSSDMVETFGMVNNQTIYFDIALHAQSLNGRMTVVFTSSVMDTSALKRFADHWRSIALPEAA